MVARERWWAARAVQLLRGARPRRVHEGNPRAVAARGGARVARPRRWTARAAPSRVGAWAARLRRGDSAVARSLSCEGRTRPRERRRGAGLDGRAGDTASECPQSAGAVWRARVPAVDPGASPRPRDGAARAAGASGRVRAVLVPRAGRPDLLDAAAATALFAA